MRHRDPVTFESEAALCQAFLRNIPDEWIAYPETAGWDILLVHRIGGWQIGVEAKLTLNAKVIAQAINGERYDQGPDFRAVLVGKVVAENKTLAHALGLTVITPKGESQWRFAKRKPAAHPWDWFGPHIPTFTPDLPESESLVKIGEWWSDWDRQDWFDRFPINRHALPDYVPEVAAGVPSPMILSHWKIKAMRVCQWVDKNSTITRAQFKALGIDPSRWMNGVWLKPGETRGEWVRGDRFPGDQFRKEHPNIWEKIAADFETWSAKVSRPQ